MLIVYRINRAGGEQFSCSGQKGVGTELKGPLVTIKMREKLGKWTETHGTNTQRSPSSFEWHWLADIHMHCLI